MCVRQCACVCVCVSVVVVVLVRSYTEQFLAKDLILPSCTSSPKLTRTCGCFQTRAVLLRVVGFDEGSDVLGLAVVHNRHRRRCCPRVRALRFILSLNFWVNKERAPHAPLCLTCACTGMVSSAAVTFFHAPPATTSAPQMLCHLAPAGKYTLRPVAPCAVIGATRYRGPRRYLSATTPVVSSPSSRF